MQIHGINKLTLLDYPEHTACTLFTGGCSFRCPFCQNGSLVLDPAHEPVIDEEWLWGFLEKRRHVLQGVCITGGEPTLQKDLPEFIRKVRELGYHVKLDTNGYQPEVLEALLEEGLLDMVAMDIKSSKTEYAKAAGLDTGAKTNGLCEKSEPAENICSAGKPQFDLARIEKSVDLLKHSGIVYEFRTTMVRNLITREDMVGIGEWLEGSPRYFLQNYEDSEYVLDRTMQGFSPSEMQEMLEIVRAWIPETKIRGLG